MDEERIEETDETDETNEELHEADETAAILDRYQRTLAEFDNFRKRTAKELAGRYDDGVRAVCERLLPIIDNFERALASESRDDPFFTGIELIARQFGDLLKTLGVEEIPAETGTQFNAHLHNAVAHIQDESLGTNTIAEVLQSGYIHKGKVLRHTMVQVAN